MQDRCGYPCDQLSFIGQRIQRVDVDTFRVSNSTISTGLTTLFMSKNSLSYIADGAFSDFEALQFLFFPDNRLESVSPGVFNGIRDTLYMLDLSVNSIRDLSFSKVKVPSLPNLYYLKIYKNLIEDLPSLL